MPEHLEHPREPIRFGKYLLDEELARGGMSRVYRARLQGPGGFEKKLVVKQILPELAADPEFVELFVQEANTLVQLSHPNLVPVYELGVVDGTYFLAMEWVQGATVAQLLQAGPLPAAMAAQIGAQVAEALHYAHERFNIIHRDVTPRNIIVDAAGHARLLDFGIAARTEHTGHGELFGSPGYMSPEQLRGEALGPESDLFALGCVLYEAIGGKQAWPGTRDPADFTTKPPPAALSGDAAQDALLHELIFGLLSLERAARPQPASVVADRLRTWLSEHQPRGLRPELAERVVKAQVQAAAEPLPTTPPLRESSGRIEVRSIAVNQELSELLRHATEKLERPVATPLQPSAAAPTRPAPPPPRPEDSMGNDPELWRVAKRFLRDIVIVTLALFAALIYARTRDRPRIMGTLTPPGRTVMTPLKGAPPSAAKPPVQPTPVAPAPPPAEPTPQPSAAEPVPAPAPNPPSEPSGANDTNKRGFLSVSAAPWAEVRVDGRLLGTTPRRSLPLRAGKHVLSLSCPPLAHSAQVPIDVASGQDVTVSADMHESPPQVTIH